MNGDRDNGRCAVCGWSLSGKYSAGPCTRGNCSQRPLPRPFYDPERALEEYGGLLKPDPSMWPMIPEKDIPRVALQALFDKWKDRGEGLPIGLYDDLQALLRE